MIRERDRLVGEAPAFLEALDEVSAVAPLEKPVLIVGERGTGKELIAARRRVHRRRARTRAVSNGHQIANS